MIQNTVISLQRDGVVVEFSLLFGALTINDMLYVPDGFVECQDDMPTR